MKTHSCTARALILAFGWSALAVVSAHAEPLVALSGHVSEHVQSATKMGRVPGDERISLRLVARIDSALLDQTLQRLYGPNAAGPIHFLSAAEFTQTFGLADKRAQLKSFAQAQGLTVDLANDQPDSMIVNVSGPASAVESAFHVQLNHYRKNDGGLFHAVETDPLIPAALAPHLSAILGLSNGMNPARPHFRMTPVAQRSAAMNRSNANSTAAVVLTGTGPGGTLAPADIKTIYGLNSVALNGAGQTLALFELDGFTPSDITQYESHFGLSAPPITYIAVDGQPNTPGGGAGEVTLDIELAVALAPGLSKILVYGGPNPSGILDLYDKIAADNLAKIVSTSWGLNEQDSGNAFLQSENTIFQRMAAQGQTIYAASGDCGAYDQQNGAGCITTNGFRVDDPASQPYVTGVGGTSLTGTISAPVETTWNEFSINNGGGGGGISAVWTLSQTQAPYQIGLAGTASQQFRNVPDVSLNSDPDTSPYGIYFAGAWYATGGTSAAAPLWAAMTALIDQSRIAVGKNYLGFANPTLYSLASSTIYNDVTTGNNAVPGHYNAGPGYDNATGLGSFKGSALISAVGSATVTTPPVAITTLDNIYAFPNPWDVRKGGLKKITFANVPDGTAVKIFTLSGFWIKTVMAENGQAVWDLTNDAGHEAASGLYLYLASNGDTKVKGKIALIR